MNKAYTIGEVVEMFQNQTKLEEVMGKAAKDQNYITDPKVTSDYDGRIKSIALLIPSEIRRSLGLEKIIIRGHEVLFDQ